MCLYVFYGDHKAQQQFTYLTIISLVPITETEDDYRAARAGSLYETSRLALITDLVAEYERICVSQFPFVSRMKFAVSIPDGVIGILQ